MKQSELTPTVLHAMAIIDYWNRNYFEGRLKTEQTLRAEALLVQAGIDPSQIGTNRKKESREKDTTENSF